MIQPSNSAVMSSFAQKNDSARILVVDDDLNVLSAVGQLLRAHKMDAETFSSPIELLDSIHPDDVGCVVTDLEMPDMNGISVQNRLLEMGSRMSLVVITAHADVPRTIELMSKGAVTLLEKPFRSSLLLEAVEKAIDVSLQNHAKRSKIEQAVELIGLLTSEELEVMKLAAAGLPNKAISTQLDMSLRTIDRRRQSSLQKLGVVSVADFAVLYAQSQDNF